MGLLTSLTIAAALAVDFLLLPALLIAFDRRAVTAKEREPQLPPASRATAPALG
jgi:hypothetical protein